MELNYTEKQIIAEGKKLAIANPNHKNLREARQWWKDGRPIVYSNRDMDILNLLTSANAFPNA